MKLTQSEQRTIEKVRKSLRWRTANLWVLGIAALAFLAFAAAYVFMLLGHLRQHGLTLPDLFVVLHEAEHPSHVYVLFVFIVAAMAPLTLYVALQFLLGMIVSRSIARQQRLLLKLWQAQESPVAPDKRINEGNSAKESPDTA